MFPVGGKDLISLPSIWCLYSRSQSSQEGRTPPLECYGWNKGKSFTEEGKSVRLMNLGMHVRDILGAWECFPKLKLVLVLPSFAFSWNTKCINPFFFVTFQICKYSFHVWLFGLLQQSPGLCLLSLSDLLLSLSAPIGPSWMSPYLLFSFSLLTHPVIPP